MARPSRQPRTRSTRFNGGIVARLLRTPGSSALGRPTPFLFRTERYLTTWPNHANGNLPWKLAHHVSRRPHGNTGACPTHHLGLPRTHSDFFPFEHVFSPQVPSAPPPGSGAKLFMILRQSNEQ